jgi:hypothetical protein
MRQFEIATRLVAEFRLFCFYCWMRILISYFVYTDDADLMDLTNLLFPTQIGGII